MQFALVVAKGAQVVEAAGGAGVLCAQRRLSDGQRPLIVGARAFIVAGGLEQEAQVVEAAGGGRGWRARVIPLPQDSLRGL